MYTDILLLLCWKKKQNEYPIQITNTSTNNRIMENAKGVSKSPRLHNKIATTKKEEKILVSKIW